MMMIIICGTSTAERPAERKEAKVLFQSAHGRPRERSHHRDIDRVLSAICGYPQVTIDCSKRALKMALHYSSGPTESDPKVSPRNNYSNPLPVQKTPFSIEDILYQRNKSSAAATAAAGGQIVKKLYGHSQDVSDEKRLYGHSSFSTTAPVAAQPPQPPPAPNNHSGPYSSSVNNNMHAMYPSGPTYSDGYLHMIAPYLASTATGYKSVDPYFLSQGEERDRILSEIPEFN